MAQRSKCAISTWRTFSSNCISPDRSPCYVGVTMNAYANAFQAYANRPLLRWSMAIVVITAAFTFAMRNQPIGYSMGGLLLMIGIMGVQVAGYVGATAIQLMWNDRARLTPRVKFSHAPVVA